MKSIVFNNQIGSPYDFGYPKLSKQQEDEILASLFEQLLIFDRVTISTNRLNFALLFLVNKLGINIVERLFEYGYINIFIWTPVVVTGSGMKKEDGTIDESVIYGQPPIVAASLTGNDNDPEKNIYNAINHFNINRERKRIFTRIVAEKYIIPNGLEFSTNAASIVIDAYEKNNLLAVGLPYDKESNQLDLKQRQTLLTLSNSVLETAILSHYGYKSFSNFDSYKICEQNLVNIGKAYNITEGTNSILDLVNLPDLKSLYINEKFDFEDIFTLRHLSSAKYFRKWINNIDSNSDAKDITREYHKEVEGTRKYFNTTEGKFVKNLTLFTIGTALGGVLTGTVSTVANYGLGLLDTYVLDGILSGKKPSMFINDLKKVIRK